MAEKTYTLKATNTECRFDTDELSLSKGKHYFVVKAKAEGFIDSPYSNEVTINVSGDGFILTISNDYQWNNYSLYINGKLFVDETNEKEGTYYNVKTVEFVCTTGDCPMFFLSESWDDEQKFADCNDNYDGVKWSSGVITLTENVHIRYVDK